MTYQLRNFENNMQMLASIGWIFAIIGVVTCFVGPIPAAIFLLLFGFLLIWIQLRGKRITVDTNEKFVKSEGEKIGLSSPSMVYMNEVRVSQNVNSRGSTANVKMYFYKAYIQDGEQNILISCNRSDKRDMEVIQKIAKDLQVPFRKNYE